MDLEQLVIQRKTLKEIATFLGISEAVVSRSLTRKTPNAIRNTPKEELTEEALLALPSDGEWLKWTKNRYVR